LPVQVLPPVHSLEEQQAVLAMQVPLQSFGVVPEQVHALLVQVLPPVHSLEVQQAVLAMQAPLHNFVVPEQTH